MEREFMDYHQDRFEDASLMVYNDKMLVACIPANRVDNNFYSHQGLTYGGIFLKEMLALKERNEILEKIVCYLQKEYQYIEFRWQPEIYNSYHNEFVNVMESFDFKTVQAFNNLYINLEEEIKLSSKKTVGYRNSKFKEMRVIINNDFKSFWDQILEPQLAARHDAKPVHSLKEIKLLASRFPDNIKQYLVYEHGELLAGITFFIKDTIVKSQYASATTIGMSKNANDFIYVEAINIFKEAGLNSMDCGHVNNPDGTINRGLQRFKEELGAVNQPVYRSQWTKF